MDGVEVLGVLLDAHLDAQVFDVIDVPCARMTDHLAVAGLGEHRLLPEALRERIEAERSEETLADADHLQLIDVLARLEDPGEVVTGGSRVLRRDDVVNVAPLLRPDVAEEMRGDRLSGWDDLLSVLAGQIPAHVTVHGVVERLELIPEAV